ncbi:hypothetical protein IV498_00215 [Paenarthrobacter sp. Z7-10]|uniref:hypothetical protein n=1 Tax=Paenarthrobacter sp. Z7-10 TaxID=2787635 RepID=UPI0022A957CF|nr:hypothetical protein [Paenarthrobacter sp. Z7-10]MCZ2401647.1 hypothetical protein [Paenarthrobacter sp. Z7-10]
MTTAFDVGPSIDPVDMGQELLETSSEDLLDLSDRLFRKLDTADPALEVWDQYDALTAELERRAGKDASTDNPAGVARGAGDGDAPEADVAGGPEQALNPET